MHEGSPGLRLKMEYRCFKKIWYRKGKGLNNIKRHFNKKVLIGIIIVGLTDDIKSSPLENTL